MQIRPDQLWNEHTNYPLGPTSRFFFEALQMNFKPTKRYAKRLAGLSIQDETWCEAPGCSPCWTLTFSFEGHTFHIDTNHHAAISSFFVGDRDCPDDVLLKVLNHFHRFTPISFTDADISRPPPVLGCIFLVVLLFGVSVAIVFFLLSSPAHPR